jgi:hypothetical protein
MQAKNYLKPEQLEELQKALKEEENADVRERIRICDCSRYLACLTVRYVFCVGILSVKL